MLADLDLLLTAVFATADDLLPWRRRNARRSVTDAEVVTLAVAQAIMDIPSDREFLFVAAKRLGHLFPKLPKQPGYWKRRLRLTETIEWLCAMFAQDSPGYFDEIVLLDSTPGECGRSVDTARRSALAPACAHHYSRSHSRWFWGMRLHLLAAPDGTPRAAILASADQKERDVALRLFDIGLRGGELVVCDKGYAGRDFETQAIKRCGARILRPARKNEPGRGPVLSWIRQRIESIFHTLKYRLGLERHRARSLHGL
jgi:DDE family transposase